MSRDIPLIELHRRKVLQGLGLAGAGVLAGAGAHIIGASGDDQSDSNAKLTGTDGDEKYALPDLPYEYDALEPTIDARIMKLHHAAHHQGYVDGANAALDNLEEMHETGDFEGIKRVKRDLSFNLSGHVNHTIFWKNMTPVGNGEPEGRFSDRLNEEFGSVENFREEFTKTANAVESNGWTALVYDPTTERLRIAQHESQNHLAFQDTTPLLMLDVWEHAYYLQYENRRDKYTEAWWDVVDWEDVATRYDAARTYW